LKQHHQPHFEYILFDLDETLYPREAGLMQAISERILLYMTQKVGIPAEDAPAKKRAYYQQYGTSLKGLMHDFQIDPKDFLAFVHQPNPANFFGASPPLARMLEEIPLRKVIFTNADTPHAERVLNTLQVRPYFEQIIDIEAIHYKSKPDPLAYQQALNLLGALGRRCIMVDDTARNLIPAKDVGMTTILVNGEGKSIAVDYAVPTVFHVGRILNDLLLTTGRRDADLF
jgi:putative hydrolase of the HAD superfamily